MIRRALVLLTSSFLLTGAVACNAQIGGSTSATVCTPSGCTTTFPRSGDLRVSVLGLDARLLSADSGVARLEIAGQQISLAVGAQTEVGGFSVGVREITDTHVVVTVTAG